MISARAFAVRFSIASIASLAGGAVLAVACSSSSSDGGVVAADGATDGTSPLDDGSTSSEGSATDAGADAPSGTCTGDCMTTALVADFGGKTRTLVRAQFGTEPGDGGAQLHTESHLGGMPACPTMSSPTPDYTLIVSAVPRSATPGAKLTERDHVTGAFFDFKGDLGLPPITKAITMNVTVVGQDGATPPAWVALDVFAAFTEGTVKGHLYASYCASLSQ